MTRAIHLSVDHGIQKGASDFGGGTLRCSCTNDPVEVHVDTQVLYNHACGCTQCWKPEHTLSSVVGVVPREKVAVTSHREKLKVRDDTALIQRDARTACGTHLYGRIENKERAFYGLDFIQTELSTEAGWDGPGFAPFVSSIIESGTAPSSMVEVRQTPREKGLEPYDCLSPALMDILAAHSAKAKSTHSEA
ncbi:S-(hydroxymethyl)glutathione synthase [Paraburkholderia phytofirmans]|uniref:Glutathione-dependent formaldehyde-activating enzyme n=2 Tax=Paraburkholderia phytofirmans TaxID=261302 RepID=B2TEU3_PARPJ|nr:S-(hydroxymethyl)glutathione synthase [Paraburkholderia phytofirmans]ACD18618.1 S-(hydroxymethyl)glutathione synthase [Paraburkholderia phytofirmans PsJN]